MTLPLTVRCAALHPDAWPHHIPDPGSGVQRLPPLKELQVGVCGTVTCLDLEVTRLGMLHAKGCNGRLQSRDLGPDNSCSSNDATSGALQHGVCVQVT